VTGSSNGDGLARTIRFHQLFGIGFGTMIGVGWMLVAGSWIVTAGPGGAITAFAVGAAAVLVIGLAYAEMGGAMPFSGGEIVYAFEGLGTGAAFIVGWSLTLIFVSVCAFEVVAAPWIIAVIAPVAAGPVLYSVLGAPVSVGSLLLGFAGLIALTWLNMRGSRLSVGVINLATALKVAASAIFVIAALTHGSEANRTPWFATAPGGGMVTPVLAVLATVPVWYGGFNTLPQALGEVADIGRIRRLPLVLIAAIVAGFSFFALVILATASAASRDVLAHADFPVAAALFSAFRSPLPGRAVLAAGLLGLLTSWNSSIFAGSRVLLCMGRARIIPAFFARVHPRHGTPATAARFIGFCCAPIALLGRNSIGPVLNLVGLAYATGYLFTAWAVIRLRRTAPAMDRPYRMPGHPWFTGLAALIAVVFIAVALFNIVAGSTQAVPTEFIALAVWAAMGLAVWFHGAPARAAVPLAERRRLIREG
jgi:basic amino acid/polyamine antiporter, APA family